MRSSINPPREARSSLLLASQTSPDGAWSLRSRVRQDTAEPSPCLKRQRYRRQLAKFAVASKNGQLQSLETIGIVIILLLVLLLGGFLFINATKGDAANTVRRYQVQRAEAIVATISDLPELRCPSYGASTTPCLDLLAVGIFDKWVGNTQSAELKEGMRLSYHGVFGDSFVQVQKLYPDDASDPQASYILYNATNAENVFGQDVPVALYDAQTNTYKLGVVHVETQ